MGTPAMDQTFVDVMKATSDCLKALSDDSLTHLGHGLASSWRQVPRLRVFLDTLNDEQIQAVARAANSALMCEAKTR